MMQCIGFIPGGCVVLGCGVRRGGATHGSWGGGSNICVCLSLLVLVIFFFFFLIKSRDGDRFGIFKKDPV